MSEYQSAFKSAYQKLNGSDYQGLNEQEKEAVKAVLDDCINNTENIEEYYNNGSICGITPARNGRLVAWCSWSESNESNRYVDTLEKLDDEEVEKELL